MSDLGEHSLCSLRPLLRARLLCGLYSARAVPPRWRPVARTYCLCVLLILSYLLYMVHAHLAQPIALLYNLFNVSEYYLAAFISMWTGDEYLNTYYMQNNFIDDTLDSRVVFTRLQKRIDRACVWTILLFVLKGMINVGLYHGIGQGFSVLVIPLTIIEVCATYAVVIKIAVMGLFAARMLVLKRRLLRYGFGARAPPYCRLYDEVWKGLEATGGLFKISILFDLFFSCAKMICRLLTGLHDMRWHNSFGNYIIATAAYHVLLFAKTLVFSFGHIMLLEAADAHCDDMAVFTVTQLIKNPTAAERARMRAFLAALARRGARYRVARALPLDARLVMQALGFCSAQVVVFANTLGT